MRWNAFWKILRRNWRAAIYLFVLAALAVLLVVVCVRRGQTAAQPEPTPRTSAAVQKDAAQTLLDGMSTCEKICQLLIVQPEALTDGGAVTAMTDDLAAALRDYPVGGFLLSAGNMTSGEQLRALTSALSSACAAAPLVTVDEEGGRVARLMNTVGTTKLNSMYSYRSLGTQGAYDNAQTLAHDIAAYGFNTDFAPVADVWTNKRSNAIGDRAYSDDYGEAAELVAAAYCFGEADCTLAVVELPDAGLAAVLPQMPVCAVTAVGPDGVSRSVERLAALAGGVMRKDSICVTAPEQPKAVLSELVVAAGKCGCELVVPDPEDITFLEAEQFASRVDYGGYTVPLAFLGRHAAGNAAMAVELALALCRKGVDISDEAILDGIAAVDNRCSIRVLSQRPLVILDACRTPQQAAALLRVLNMAKVRHMSAIIGLTEEEGAEAFFSALETGLSPEEQKKDKSTMPGMSESPFDKVYLVTPAGVEEQLTRRLTEKAKYHFDAQLCTSLDEAVQLAHANTRRGLLVCGSEAAALEAAELLAKA